MKKIMSVVIIMAMVLISVISVHAAQTRTVWTEESYDGTAYAFAGATYSRATAFSSSESPFVRAIYENASGRLSIYDEQPAGYSVSARADASDLPDPTATLETSFAWAFIGDLEVVCSQYY